MSTQEHTSPPWPEDTAIPIPAGDARVLLSGSPPRTACRVLAEPNYVFARACVNAQDAMLAALKKAEQRLNESGTGEMGLIDTIHAVYAIIKPAIAKAEGVSLKTADTTE